MSTDLIEVGERCRLQLRMDEHIIDRDLERRSPTYEAMDLGAGHG